MLRVARPSVAAMICHRCCCCYNKMNKNERRLSPITLAMVQKRKIEYSAGVPLAIDGPWQTTKNNMLTYNNNEKLNNVRTLRDVNGQSHRNERRCTRRGGYCGSPSTTQGRCPASGGSSRSLRTRQMLCRRRRRRGRGYESEIKSDS